MAKAVIFSGMTDLLTDYSHYSIQTVSSRPEGVTDKTSVLGVSEVIFRASRKPRSTPEEWRQSAPGGRRL
ncbi:hypothetical protein [Butyricimonas sp. BSD2780061689_150309_C8]|uniref:hypothetical protein n=1 Tax=Butyricimonas sp. BSD2780061689_150309_C8 TaxID=2787088 RepID=UPI00189F5048|nr:hypothetical protein [Butyricimonas sp. BSD2780061689_150309_C8]